MKKKILPLLFALVLLFNLGIAAYAAPCADYCLEPRAMRAWPGSGGSGGDDPPNRPGLD